MAHNIRGSAGLLAAALLALFGASSAFAEDTNLSQHFKLECDLSSADWVVDERSGNHELLRQNVYGRDFEGVMVVDYVLRSNECGHRFSVLERAPGLGANIVTRTTSPGVASAEVYGERYQTWAPFEPAQFEDILNRITMRCLDVGYEASSDACHLMREAAIESDLSLLWITLEGVDYVKVAFLFDEMIVLSIH